MLVWNTAERGAERQPMAVQGEGRQGFPQAGCQQRCVAAQGCFISESCYWKMSLFIVKSSHDAGTLITPKPSQHKIAAR